MIYNQQFIIDRVIIDENSCWIWQGPTDGRLYGSVGDASGESKAHRLSFRLFNGPIPFGLLVCHKCDMPLCVNPKHLFIGTHSDNALDAVAKGRHRYVSQGGWNRIPQSTVEEILERNEKGEHKIQIANALDLAISTVYNTIRRHTHG